MVDIFRQLSVEHSIASLKIENMDDPHFSQKLLEIIYKDKKSRTAFDILHIEDTPENRMRLLVLFMKSEIPKIFPGLCDERTFQSFKEMTTITSPMAGIFFKNIYVLLEGSVEKEEKHSYDFSSFPKHARFTGLMAAAIYEAIKNNNVDENNEEVNTFLEHTSLEDMYYIGLTHDIGRIITHSSKHDEYGEQLLHAVKVRRPIIDGHHKPAPIHESIDPQTYDSIQQSISRLSDLFGKIILKDDAPVLTIRTTIEQIISLSQERQQKYWQEEHTNPDSMWYQTTEDDLKRYLENEKALLIHAVHVLQGLNLHWNSFIAYIQENHIKVFGKAFSAI